MVHTTPSKQQAINTDVDDLMCDDDITTSLNPFPMVKKRIKKLNAKLLHLLFIQLQTEENREDIDRLMKRIQGLNVNYGIFNKKINSFRIIYFVLVYVMIN
jgi:hypothetical protein